ncbi:phosphonate ABC transporter, permease protein PhnE [Deinococcus sp. KSM4-11]|uniref:phosphonate ABC transporter, permease protein PhnE n=1 Tax=Deinococcus sp. KSM4-11 TaxID=2568654 RepID=UPI00197AD6ED|nr:phosphonate ABC transporter, permease protein PhnE [Deinococcus sp. KSM4-11]
MTLFVIAGILGAVIAVLSGLAGGSMRRLGLAGALTSLLVAGTLPLTPGVGLRATDTVSPTVLGLLPVAPWLLLSLLALVASVWTARRGGRVAALGSVIAGAVLLLSLIVWTRQPSQLAHVQPLPGVMEVVAGLLLLALVQVFTWTGPQRRTGLLVGFALGVALTGYLLSPDGRTKFPSTPGYYRVMRPVPADETTRLISGYNADLANLNAIRKSIDLPPLPPIKAVSELGAQGLPQAIADQGYRLLQPARPAYGEPVLFLTAALLLVSGLLHLRRPQLQQASDWLTGSVIAVLVTLLVPSFAATNFNLSQLVRGAPFLRDFLSRSWPPNLAQVNPQNPSANIYPLQEVMSQMALTVEIALVGTFIATLFALPLSFLAARNLTARHVLMRASYVVVRTFFNVDRGIDTLILALVFVAAVGLGPFAGVLAMAIHSVADLGKLYSEAIENAERGPIEALESVGATGTNVLRWGILPQVLPLFTSYTLYRFEINFRVSIVLGFVGAGGIGFFIQGAMASGHYDQMIIGVIAIIVIVNLIDFLSSELRRRLV